LLSIPHVVYLRSLPVLSEKSIIDPIYSLKNLQLLDWGDTKNTIQVSRFKNLKTLLCEGTENIILDKANSISYLYFRRLKNLNLLPFLTGVKKLELRNFGGNNLNGIENLINIRELIIKTAKNLDDISEIVKCINIDSIEIENIKNTLDYSCLKKCKSITQLYLRVNIKSCGFISKMPILETFLCTGEIDDANLNPLFESNSLRSVYIKPFRKKYNKSQSDIEDRFGFY
jgi:hypothetical protein